MGNCLCNFYRLHLTNGKISQHCLGIKVHFYFFQPVSGVLIHFFMVYHFNRTEAFQRETAFIKVLSHASCRNRLKLLMYHRDTIFHGLVRVIDGNLLSIEINFTGIHLVDTEEAFHQSGFSCAVLTHQCMHGSRAERQLYVVQRLYAWEGFTDSLHLQLKFCHILPPSFFNREHCKIQNLRLLYFAAFPARIFFIERGVGAFSITRTSSAFMLFSDYFSFS